MAIEWDSYGVSVPAVDIDAAAPHFPAALRDIYQGGDAPFICNDNDCFPVYDIPQAPGQIGSCLNFVKLADPSSVESLQSLSHNHVAVVDKGFCPIAFDGGRDLLLLKPDGTNAGSIWHYSPSGRLDPKETFFCVAGSFETFLEKIRYVQDG